MYLDYIYTFFYKYYFIKDIMISVKGTDSGRENLATIFAGIQDEFFPLNLVLKYVRSS